MNKIIIVDTREKGHKKILEYFDEVGQDYIISKLDAGDYMYFKEPKVIIDRKDNLLELVNNLCNHSEHERVRREILLAKEMGCEMFIFLIAESNIKTAEDIKKWSSPHSMVSGETIYKIMNTMSQKYGVKFVFVPRKEMGSKIIKYLSLQN